MTISHLEAKQFWTLLLAHWFSALRYAHSQQTHSQILASLCNPGVRSLYELLELEMNWDEFRRQVRALAWQAEQKGLVRPDGSPRANARGRAGRPRKSPHLETELARRNMLVRRDRSDCHTTQEDARGTTHGSGCVSWQA